MPYHRAARDGDSGADEGFERLFLSLENAQIDRDLSEAKLVLDAFKDVHNQTQYATVVTLLIVNQQTSREQMKRLSKDADGPFVFPTDCKLHVVDLDGLASLNTTRGYTDMTPVYVLSMTMGMEIKELEVLKVRLQAIGK